MLTPCGHSRTIRLGSLALHAQEWGTPGHPGLVLLHSLAAHAHWWDWAAPYWADRFHVVALDFRGHGGSDHVQPPAYAFTDHVDDVAGALAALGLEQPVVIGHSLGAYVGALLAATSPDRVRAVVIADMLTGWTDDFAAFARRQAHRPSPLFATREDAAARFRLQPADTAAPDAHVRHLGAMGVRPTATGDWRLAFDPGVFLHPPVDPWPFLPRVACPALVVCGAASTLMPPDAAERVAAALPRGRAVVIAGAYHHVNVDAPEAFARAVSRFLEA
jgi:pimeloyl-ACP methyl ester carboxylesterase